MSTTTTTTVEYTLANGENWNYAPIGTASVSIIVVGGGGGGSGGTISYPLVGSSNNHDGGGGGSGAYISCNIPVTNGCGIRCIVGGGGSGTSGDSQTTNQARSSAAYAGGESSVYTARPEVTIKAPAGTGGGSSASDHAGGDKWDGSPGQGGSTPTVTNPSGATVTEYVKVGGNNANGRMKGAGKYYQYGQGGDGGTPGNAGASGATGYISLTYNILWYSVQFSVSGSGTVKGSSNETLTTASVKKDTGVFCKAVANEGNHFVRWSDNNTDIERVLYPGSDMSLTAYFAPDVHAHILQNGVWKDGEIYVKMNDTWTRAKEVDVKMNNVWSKVS